MKKFATPKTFSADAVKEVTDNVSSDEYIFYTGGKYSRRRKSGRSISLSTITEKRKPIALTEYVKRAANAEGKGKGFGTDISVGGLGLHAGAKPAVYLYLRKVEKGYVAAKDFPTPDPTLFKGSLIKEGSLVLDTKGAVIPSLKK